MPRNRTKDSNESNNTEGSPRIECPGNVWHSTIIEQIEVPGCGNHYAIHEKMSDDSWRTREDIQFPDPHGKGILVPKQRTRWPLPGRLIEYGSDEQLYDEVREFYKSNLDLSDDKEYYVLAAFTLMTWRFEQFETVPYLLFIGPKESGKSRALECLAAICYRGWLTTHPSVASLHHVMNTWHPTFLLDNFESLPRERRYEMEGIFNAGYRRGGAVDRVESLPEGGFKEKWYEVYSPKALAGTREPSEALASRCIIIRMSKSQKPYPKSLDAERAQQIRSKLLTYRFKHLSSPQESQPDIPNAYGRLGEIFAPLVSVAPNQETLNRLLDYGNAIRLEREEEEKASFNAQVLRAVINSKEDVEGSRLSIKAITDNFNEGRPDKEHTKSWHISRALARLGFSKVRMPDKSGSRGILWNQTVIRRLAARYGIELTSTETPLVPLYFVSDASDCQKQVQEIEAKSDALTDLTHLAGIPGGTSKPDEPSKMSNHNEIMRALRGLKSAAKLDDFVDYAAIILKDRDKAKSLVDRLCGDGELAEDPEGRWCWTRA